MKWFRDLKIATKIFSVVGVLLALMAGTGGFAVVQLSRVNATSTEIEVSWLPSVRLLGEIEAGTSLYRRYELQHIMSTTEQDFDTYEQRLKESRAWSSWRLITRRSSPAMSSASCTATFAPRGPRTKARPSACSRSTAST